MFNYDDFSGASLDLIKWVKFENNGSVTQSGGQVVVSGTGAAVWNGNGIISNDYFTSQNTIVRFTVTPVIEAAICIQNQNASLLLNDVNQPITLVFGGDYNIYRFDYGVNYGDVGTYVSGTEYNFDFHFSGTTVQVRVTGGIYSNTLLTTLTITESQLYAAINVGTSGSINCSYIANMTTAPVCSPNGGLVTANSTLISLSTTTPGSTIYYSKQGLLPPTVLSTFNGNNGDLTFNSETNQIFESTSSSFGYIDSSQNPFGSGSSAFFPDTGESGASRFNIPKSADYNFGSDDFCIEFFARLPSGISSGRYLVLASYSGNTVGWGADNNIGWHIEYVDAGVGQMNFFINQGGPTVLQPNGCFLTANTWHHLAFTRQSGLVRLFYDGNLMGTNTMPTMTFCTNVGLCIGNIHDTDYHAFAGWISNFRIIKGRPVYTSSFTVPSAPLTLLENTYSVPFTLPSTAIVTAVATTADCANSSTTSTNFLTGTYLDISVDDGIGLMDGSDTSNYMGWNQFLANGNPDVYYLAKGQRVYSGNFLSGKSNITIDAWDIATNGPWRINSTSGPGTPISSTGLVNLKQGILYGSGAELRLESGILDRCYVRGFATVFPQTIDKSSIVRNVHLNYDGCARFDASGFVYNSVFQTDDTPAPQIWCNPGVGTITYLNVATDRPTLWADSGSGSPLLFYAQTGGMPVGSGERLSMTLTNLDPSFTETSLTLFDVFPGYGVGAPGGWAYSPYYVNAAGTDVAPYKTIAGAAHNFRTLLDNIVLLPGDIIKVVNDGTINDTSSGFLTFPVAVTIEANNPADKPKIDAQQIYASYRGVFEICSGSNVRNLEINSPEGADASYAIGSLDQHSSLQNIEISGCKVNSARSITLRTLGTLSDIKIFNNVVIGGVSGMYIQGGINNVSNIDIVNNTVVKQSQIGIMIGASGTGSDTVHINNNNVTDIPSQWGIYFTYAEPSIGNLLIDYDYNNVFNCSVRYIMNSIPFSIPDPANSVSGDPQYVNLIGNDLHIQSGSASKDVGESGSRFPTTDYDGLARPQNVTYDMGAYEIPVPQYWVDLDVTGPTGADGLSPANYWGWLDFSPDNNTPGWQSGFTYNMKGSHNSSFSGAMNLSSTTVIKNWGTSPWRWFGSAINFGLARIEGAIIGGNGRLICGELYNTYIDDDEGGSYDGHQMSLGEITTVIGNCEIGQRANCVFHKSFFANMRSGPGSQFYGSTLPTLYLNDCATIAVDLFTSGGQRVFYSDPSAYLDPGYTLTFLGISPPAKPLVTDPVLTHFDLYPGYGVGAVGGWAASPVPVDIVYDDFSSPTLDTSKWTSILNGGSITQSAGKVYVLGNTTSWVPPGNGIISKGAFIDATRVKWKIQSGQENLVGLSPQNAHLTDFSIPISVGTAILYMGGDNQIYIFAPDYTGGSGFYISEAVEYEVTFTIIGGTGLEIRVNGGAYINQLVFTGSGIFTSNTLYAEIQAKSTNSVGIYCDYVESDVTAQFFSVVETPVISPSAGTYVSSVDVTITCATSGADIYYTTDGSTPTVGSTLYTGLFTLTESKTIKTIGIKAGSTDSTIATTVFEVKVATPVISPVAATYITSVDVTMSCATSGADIYYTTDGSTPSVGSTLYTGLFTLAESKTVKAIGIRAGDTDSNIAENIFTIKVDVPSISPNGGTFVASVPVSLSCTTSGASIYYTTDGSTPSGSSTLYTIPFSLTENATVKAIGIKTGLDDSDITQADFYVKVFDPTISPVSATYTTSVQITLACSTSGAAIHYTTDGSTPTGSSALYFVPFTLMTTSPVKAIAVKINMSDSDVVASLFTIQSAAPQIHPNGGTSLGFIQITLTCTTPSVTIHYTTDGSTPTGASPVYTAAFKIYSTSTVQAIAIKSGTLDSAVASAYFIINSSPEITIHPRSGSVLEGQTIGLNVTATGGTPNLTYQWRFNGESIPLATSASLTVPNCTVANAGAYDVVVSNSYSGVISNQALIDVTKQTPEVTIDPTKRETAVSVPASPKKGETL